MSRLTWAEFGEAKIRKAVDRDHAAEIAMGLDPQQLLDYLIFVDDEIAIRYLGFGAALGCNALCCTPPIPDGYDMRFVELRVPFADLMREAFGPQTHRR